MALAVAGCGDDDGAPDASAPPPTALTVRAYDGEQLVSTTDLACTADDFACARVVEIIPQLRPVKDEACTLLYGGPERYVIEGTVEGEPVDIEVTRQNGCDIARYDLLEKALAG